MISLSFKLNLGSFGLDCARNAYKMLQGGNFWSGWVAFLSFFRHVVKLDIDYSKFDHYEKASIHGSYRFMHEEFCIVSDRPTRLEVDSQNRPHRFDGAYIEWSDGTGIYAIHGVHVPAWICETKREDFTKEMILSEVNVDSRRCIIQKIGIERTIELLGAEVVDTYVSKVGGEYQLLMVDYDGRGKMPYLKMRSQSIDAWHIEGIHPTCDTVKKALMFRNQTKVFIEPEMMS